MKKRITKLLAVGCICALLVGSFAYFTDKVSSQATATVGNINLVFNDISDADAGSHYDSNLSVVDGLDTARDKVWTAGKLLVDGAVLNPGDTVDMSFNVANTGSKSIDVRPTLKVTSDKQLPTPALSVKVGAQSYPLTGGQLVDTKYVYSVNLGDDFILDGTAEKDAAVAATQKDYAVSLVFDRAAKNEAMGASLTFDLTVLAKQHRNTGAADWAAVAEFQVVADN